MTEEIKMTNYLLSFIHGIKEAGVREVVISPGSRSTPLAILFYRDSEITCFVDVDERSAAFFALGIAKGKQRPVGIVCTSGTAAANYYPAVCEAEGGNLPLIVMTADRPPELQGVGAPQAMDQSGLYASHVKKMVDLAVPEDSEALLRYSYWQGVSTVSLAQTVPKGPVHINLPLREPLLPTLHAEYPPSGALVRLDQEQLRTVDFSLNGSIAFPEKGVIIVGGALTKEEANWIMRFARALKWPILADPLANISYEDPSYIREADLMLQVTDPQFVPESVWRFGPLPVTKSILLWLKKLPESTDWVFWDEGSTWKEQLQMAETVIDLPVSLGVPALIRKIKSERSTEWLKAWREKAQVARKQIDHCTMLKELNESSAAVVLAEEIAENEQLFLSNSNSIRFVDRLAGRIQGTVFGNRGVNGIDGIVSTAAGLATNGHPTFLLTGDLALFHDMNGLQMIKQYQLPVTILLLNNDGGGIFSFLPQSTLPTEEFDPLFATPLGLSFQKVAELYEAEYACPATLDALRAEIKKSQHRPRFALIEVAGTQEEPVVLWKKLVSSYKNEVAD